MIRRGIIQWLCLAPLLISGVFSVGAADDPDGSTFKWLPVPDLLSVPRGERPTRIQQWKSEILRVTAPVRTRLLKPEAPVTAVTVEAVFYEVAASGWTNVTLPQASSNSVGDLFVAELTHPQVVKFRQRAVPTNGFVASLGPRVTTLPGRQTVISQLTPIQINGTNAYYGMIADLLPDVDGNYVRLRSFLQWTQPVTNLVESVKSGDQTEEITIEPVFAVGFEAKVWDGNTLIIWRNHSNEVGHLILLTPVVYDPVVNIKP